MTKVAIIPARGGISKIALGTVQFGMNYGISNTTGQVSFDEIGKILDYCKASAIDTLDTAQGYGECEKILGQFDLFPYKIITKLLGSARLETSLENLRLSSIYGLMFHSEKECNDQTWKQFEYYKAQGLVKKIGVSVYSPKILNNLIERYPIDIVQFPMNILDQRFIPLLGKLKNKGIEVHSRSTFLQGLLLMKSIPPFFAEIEDKISAIPFPRLEHALAFVKAQSEIDRMVLGVTKLQDLKEICAAFNAKLGRINYSKYSITNEKFINPSMWKLDKQ